MKTIEKFRIVLVIATLAAALSCDSDARPALPIQTTPETGVADPRFEEAISEAGPMAAALTRESPAVSVAVAVNGEIVWSAAYGFSDFDARTPALPSDRFRLYSLSKIITTAAMMRLVEQGTLDLDAPVERYAPGYLNPGGAITPRRLAGHLAGIRHYRDGEALWTRRCNTVDEAVAVFSNDELLNPAGSEYLYSSWGYVLLSKVLEGASGNTYADVVSRLVFQPAGVSGIELEARAQPTPKMVSTYEPDGDSVRTARIVDNSCKWGAGAFIASAEDVARLLAALVSGKIVGDKSLQVMLTPMTTADGASTDYGMGLGVTTDSAGRRRAVHSGSAIGGRAALYMLPDDSIVVVVLSNVEGERLTSAAGSIAGKFVRSEPQDTERR